MFLRNVSIYQKFTRFYNPENQHWHLNHCENLKPPTADRRFNKTYSGFFKFTKKAVTKNARLCRNSYPVPTKYNFKRYSNIYSGRKHSYLWNALKTFITRRIQCWILLWKPKAYFFHHLINIYGHPFTEKQETWECTGSIWTLIVKLVILKMLTERDKNLEILLRDIQKQTMQSVSRIHYTINFREVAYTLLIKYTSKTS